MVRLLEASVTVIVATGGGGGGAVVVTVNTVCPVTPPLVALMVVVPAVTDVARPALFTVATPAFDVPHVMVRPLSAFPCASRGVAENCTVAPC